MPEKVIRVMFVCMGNICRSPMAEAVFSHLVEKTGLREKFKIASSGTDSWHVGERPHSGTQEVLKRNGVHLDKAKRAQQFQPSDIDLYDYILAMDEQNIRSMPPNSKVRRLLEYSSDSRMLDVPDPYYERNFDVVYNLVLDASSGLLKFIREDKGI